ncbi:MAG: hypothetical protein N2D54_10925, partial [Chloroflexota bacterium]
AVLMAFSALARRTAELGAFPDLAITLTPHYYVALAIMGMLAIQVRLGVVTKIKSAHRISGTFVIDGFVSDRFDQVGP